MLDRIASYLGPWSFRIYVDIGYYTHDRILENNHTWSNTCLFNRVLDRWFYVLRDGDSVWICSCVPQRMCVLLKILQAHGTGCDGRDGGRGAKLTASSG